ncbi:hypothetical protein CBS147339_9494 [Penicillium roqueforti]|uniref:uncharacterized protein n=1 Tax=Penicillium roqueforti TaxID=5082 RepID=UPI00190AD52F|nr:uncharacterized protein LCP9604111_1189 [Penicillium roqueforti]KAF9253663.1 hypothetical protein LCP9604111_1189 [Penicillium roqueforti]KAI1839180.1 hypothetical protein CBS147337_905 [Penicillium roqueforti]KAI2691638.1 hypothetical protein LCP963914a_1839 [Penicillium roqueforti]KAI2731439.1 hypothetical protein CBS147354_548 [Penicillium roqueforti]KAI2743103.1 hypothetical protein DTO013F2_8313 [Penicillium roqueforti]
MRFTAVCISLVNDPDRTTSIMWWTLASSESLRRLSEFSSTSQTQSRFVHSEHGFPPLHYFNEKQWTVFVSCFDASF